MLSNNNNLSQVLKLKYLLPIILILTLVFSGLFFLLTRNNQPKALGNPQTSLIINILELEQGTPLSIRDNLDSDIQIFNKEPIQVLQGQYSITLQVDGKGYIDEKFEVKANQENNYSFEIKTNESNSSNYSALPIKNLRPLQEQPIKEQVQSQLVNPIKTVSKGSNGHYAVVVNTTPATFQQKLLVIKPSTSNDQNQRSESANEMITITDNCQIEHLSFNNAEDQLRYFKLCPEKGENGFFSFDLASGVESQLLVTSEISNTERISFHPSKNELAYSKSDGEFGYILGDKVVPVFTGSGFGTSSFSPDGKYVVVVENASNPNSSLYTEQFKQNIIQFDWEELKALGQSAPTKNLGQTFYIPRSSNQTNNFWQWLDSDSFYAGDSNTVFNLNSTPTITELPENYKTGQLISSGGETYNYFAGLISNSQDRVLVSGIEKIVYTKDGFYYLKNGYLYRLDNQIQTLAHPTKLASVNQTETQFILITSTGEILTTQI